MGMKGTFRSLSEFCTTARGNISNQSATTWSEIWTFQCFRHQELALNHLYPVCPSDTRKIIQQAT